MILRRLVIFGFKSFADKTEFRFADGITAVIGPNGGGKSNVVDAIRWVFGEQRATILRSAHMQDVIFSGTQGRQPLNFAEVTLTISNARGLLPIEYNEVAITRRIYRSGESEYLINRTPSRLKDIHDLFLDTGIASSAYTTIENAMINRILSDKAEDRRSLFEEGAGIGKYKERIRESQRKLDRTKQDLVRINDRAQEKERYVRVLARQVEKAKRYRCYRDDLQALEVGFENRRYCSLTEAMASRRKSLSVLTDSIEKLRSKAATAESGIEKNELDKIEKENAVQIAARDVADVSERIGSLDREVSVSRQSLTYLGENMERLEREIASLESRAAEKQELLSRIERSIIEGSRELEQHTSVVENAVKELAQSEESVRIQRLQADERSEEQLLLVHELGEKQRSLSTSQTNLDNCVERYERVEGDVRVLECRIEEHREAVEACTVLLKSVSESFRNHVQAREVLKDRVEKENDRYHELIEKEKHLEARIDTGKAQRSFLEGLNATFEGYSAGVKALLTENLGGTMGIVADLINVKNSSMVGVIERALGPALQTVVLRTDDDMRKAIDFLRSEKAGIARMVSLERLVSVVGEGETSEAAEAESLLGQVETERDCRVLARHLLRHVYVCESADAALALPAVFGGDTVMVSRDGVVSYANGTVVAGEKKTEQQGLLYRKQEIERLAEEVESLQQELEKVIHDKNLCVINRDEAKQALVEVDEKLNNGRQAQHEQETNIKHYESEIEDIRDRIDGLRAEEVARREDAESHKAAIADAEQGISGITGRRNELESLIQGAREVLADAESGNRKLAEKVRDLELEKHGLVNRIGQNKKSVEHLEGDLQSNAATGQQKIADRNSTTSDIMTTELNIVGLQEKLKRQTAKREKQNEVLAGVREDYNAMLALIDVERHALKSVQAEVGSLAGRKHEVEMEQVRDEEQRRAIRERIYETYEIDLDSPPEDVPMIEREDAEVTENIQVLKERLRRVGEVNMAAIPEFEQEKEELRQLTVQRDDLQTAVDELERAIKKLNREARSRFVETFDLVRKNFTEMFTALFEGGEATLSLEENMDPLEAPIHINARPAGKKMRGVTLLSGGERALTAISLLFALYMVKPSAYCILDELDAPLDDANVDRFVRILHRFSTKTQFIVITHNKRTMEAAGTLYGVTQQEAGVSTVASIQLHEVLALEAA